MLSTKQLIIQPVQDCMEKISKDHPDFKTLNKWDNSKGKRKRVARGRPLILDYTNPRANELTIGSWIADTKIVWKCEFFSDNNVKRCGYIGLQKDTNLYIGYSTCNFGYIFWGIKKGTMRKALDSILYKITSLQSRRLKQLMK